jgi:type IV secretory pathway component VirB8
MAEAEQQVPLETEATSLLINDQHAKLEEKKSYIKLVFIVPFFLLCLLTISVFFMYVRSFPFLVSHA